MISTGLEKKQLDISWYLPLSILRKRTWYTHLRPGVWLRLSVRMVMFRHHVRSLLFNSTNQDIFRSNGGVSKDSWIFFCFRMCAWLKNIHFTLPVSSNLASWNSWNIHHRMSSIVVHQKTSISVLLINTEIFEPQLNNGWWVVTNRMGKTHPTTIKLWETAPKSMQDITIVFMGFINQLITGGTHLYYMCMHVYTCIYVYRYKILKN